MTTLRAKEQLLAYGAQAKKSWGQNFLQDADVLAAIVATDPEVHQAPCVELGAGLGALTQCLLAQGGHLVAVERDRDMMPSLKALSALHEGRLEVLEADAQRLDYGALRQRLGGRLHVFGNLPYQISSRILVSLAEAQDAVACATLLVQKEVAERLTAGPPGRTYGLLSVLVQRRFTARIVRHVPPGAFYPRPSVDSAVVVLSARKPSLWPEQAPEQEAWLTQAARAAFASRRKTLRNSLSSALHIDKERIDAALLQAGVDGDVRAETLDLNAFLAIGRALFAARSVP